MLLAFTVGSLAAPAPAPVQMTSLRSSSSSHGSALSTHASATGLAVPEPPTPEVETVARDNWRIVVAGDVLIGVGMGGFGLMVAGLAVQARGKQEIDRLALRDDPDDGARAQAEAQRKLGLELAIAGAATTAALVGTGIALVVIGNRRERARRDAQDQLGWGTGPQPWVSGLAGGLSRQASHRRVGTLGLRWGWSF